MLEGHNGLCRLRKGSTGASDGTRFPKKKPAYSPRREDMKFAAIRSQRETFAIAWMCRLLGVSRSGYYALVGEELARLERYVFLER